MCACACACVPACYTIPDVHESYHFNIEWVYACDSLPFEYKYKYKQGGVAAAADREQPELGSYGAAAPRKKAATVKEIWASRSKEDLSAILMG